MKRLISKSGPAEDLHDDEDDYAVDDQSIVALDLKLVRDARKAEIEYFKSISVYIACLIVSRGHMAQAICAFIVLHRYW